MTLEALTLELSTIQKIHTWQEVGCVVGYALFGLGFYALTPFYIRLYGATLFNLSLLPTIVYSLAFSLVVYDSEVTWLYLVGYVLVFAGLVLYSLSQPKDQLAQSKDGINDNLVVS